MIMDDGHSCTFYLEVKFDTQSARLVCIQVILNRMCSARYQSHDITIHQGDLVTVSLLNTVLVPSTHSRLSPVVSVEFRDHIKMKVVSPLRRLDLIIDLWSGKCLFLFLFLFFDVKYALEKPACPYNIEDSAWFDEPLPSTSDLTATFKPPMTTSVSTNRS